MNIAAYCQGYNWQQENMKPRKSTCSMVSNERQSACLTRVAALFISGHLCVMPMNILLQDGVFPIPKVGEVH